MLIELSLSEHNQGYWMLGEPRSLKACLNTKNRGPVSLEFLELSKPEQEKIIRSLNTGEVTCNVQTHDLWKALQGANQPVQIQETTNDRRMQVAVKLSEKRDKEDKWLTNILKGSREAVRASLVDVTDASIVRRALEKERTGRNRKSVMAIIRDRLNKINRKVQRDIAKQQKQKLKAASKRVKDKKNDMIIRESDFQRVTINTEDLLQLVDQVEEEDKVVE